jgi:hypothetical protein
MRLLTVPKIVGAAALLTALGGGAAYAFTANNDVGPTYAGEGHGPVYGYTASNIHYTLAQVLPNSSITGGYDVDAHSDVSGVSFDLNEPATSVGYVLYDSSGNTIGGGNCWPTNGSDTSFSCSAYGGSSSTNGYALVSQVASLGVIAAQ